MNIEGYLKLTEQHRVAILASRFNEFIVKSLMAGAVDALKRHGLPEDHIDIIRVPGAFELPLAAEQAAVSGRYQGLIALGAVIRGATAHFEHVAGTCISGLSQVSLKHSLPIGLGVLTTDTIEQAIERAGTKAGNKGAEAALAVIEMIDLGSRFNLR